MVVDAAWTRIERHLERGRAGRTATLKVRYADFRTITRARSQPAPFTTRAAFAAVGAALLDGLFPLPTGVRLLGLTLSAIGAVEEPPEPEPFQPSLPL